jgi:hypothetical protein
MRFHPEEDWLRIDTKTRNGILIAWAALLLAKLSFGFKLPWLGIIFMTFCLILVIASLVFHNKNTLHTDNRADKQLKIYFIGVFGIIFFFVLPLFFYKLYINNKSETSSLIYLNNKVDHYYVVGSETRSSNEMKYNIIVVLVDGSKYWIPSLNKDSTSLALLKPGVEIGVYANSHTTFRTIDGAIKSYGLWIDGHELLPLNRDLKNGEFGPIMASVICAGFGAVLLKLGLDIWRTL